jgi:hypothetical protein
MKSYIADSGVASKYWDIIGQHACLINAIVCPSPSNPDITIFEAETNSIFHLHTVPPVGCFVVACNRKLIESIHLSNRLINVAFSWDLQASEANDRVLQHLRQMIEYHSRMHILFILNQKHRKQP